MAAQVYNFPDHIKGDTFGGMKFTVTVNSILLPIESVKMELKIAENAPAVLTLASGDGITISTASDGVFEVDKQIIDITSMEYLYDIEITTKSGEIHTYINGTWNILWGITNG